MHASLTPLRFEPGALIARRRGRTWTVERLYDARPRDAVPAQLLPAAVPGPPLEEKLATVVHELWHIGPAFDGDLRRHPGRCYAHSHSQKQYDAQVDQLAERWLALRSAGRGLCVPAA